MRNLVYIVLIVLAFSSCEKDISDDFRRNDSRKIAMSAVFVADDTLRVHVSRTISLADLDSVVIIPDAIVELESEDKTVLLQHTGKGYYSSDSAIIKPDRSYILRCSSEGLPPVETSVHVPGIPAIENLQYSVDTSYTMRIGFSFQDDASTEDYYIYSLAGWLLQVERRGNPFNDSMIIDTSNVYWIYKQTIIDSIAEYDGNFGQFAWRTSIDEIDYDYPYGNMLIFSDDKINGERYDLSMEIDLFRTYNDSIHEIELFFQRQDRHLIDYLLTFERYDPYPDIEFLQPVHLYSNVEGGFGLVYSRSETQITIDVSEWHNDPDFLDRYYNR